jgi:hypothetical protein
LARRSSFAVGESSGVEEVVGRAITTDVRVVERGIEAERSARSAVWRRCERIVRACSCQLNDVRA